jgi:hypothetical protein
LASQVGKDARGCQNFGVALGVFRRSSREPVGLTDDRMCLVERYMIDADEARLRAERTAAEEARRAPVMHVSPTVEPRNTVLPGHKRPKRVGSTAAAPLAGRLVCPTRVASVMARRRVGLTLRRAAVIGLVIVKVIPPALSSLAASLADEIEMSGAGDFAFAMVVVAVAVGVGVAVAFAA